MAESVSDEGLRALEILLHEASASLRVYHNAIEFHAPSALVYSLRKAVDSSVRKVEIARRFLGLD